MLHLHRDGRHAVLGLRRRHVPAGAHVHPPRDAHGHGAVRRRLLPEDGDHHGAQVRDVPDGVCDGDGDGHADERLRAACDGRAGRGHGGLGVDG